MAAKKVGTLVSGIVTAVVLLVGPSTVSAVDVVYELRADLKGYEMQYDNSTKTSSSALEWQFKERKKKKNNEWLYLRIVEDQYYVAIEGFVETPEAAAPLISNPQNKPQEWKILGPFDFEPTVSNKAIYGEFVLPIVEEQCEIKALVRLYYRLNKAGEIKNNSRFYAMGDFFSCLGETERAFGLVYLYGKSVKIENSPFYEE